MNERVTTTLKVVLTGLALIAALVFVFIRFRAVSRVGEEGAQIYFYDESAERLYTVSRDTLPPDQGVAGPRDDGVRAVVVGPRTDACDADELRIAYLETYTPELKTLLAEVQAARLAGRPPSVTIPTSESDFFQKNTLVRRPSETTWYDKTQSQAAQIMAEWRTWSSTDGKRLAIRVP